MTVTVSAAPDTGLPAGGVADSSSFVEVGRYGSSGTPMGGWNDADLSCALQFPNGPIKARWALTAPRAGDVIKCSDAEMGLALGFETASQIRQGYWDATNRVKVHTGEGGQMYSTTNLKAS